MDLDSLKSILEGLKLNKVTSDYTHMLTGYISNPDIIEEIAKFKEDLGENVKYFCDPVLGDNGKLYISEKCFEATRKILVPIAYALAPNAYEAEWLTGLPLSDQTELFSCVEKLHSLGPTHVVVTSTNWKRRFVFFSFCKGKQQYAIETPTFDRAFTGCGDLISGLFLAYCIRDGENYEKIAAKTVNAVYEVLRRTHVSGKREMVLHECVDCLMNPPDVFKVMPMDEFRQLTIA
jgi:pyridoxine kinase